MYSFSSSGYSDESSPYIVSTPRTASAPRMAGGRPFGDELEKEQERQANLLGSYLNSAAQVEAAKYGQAPTQASRQPSIGDSLASGAGKLTSALVGELFNRGTTAAPVNYSNAFSSSGPTFNPSSFTGGFNLAPAAAGAGSPNYSSAFGSSGPKFNSSLSFGSSR